MPRSVINPLGQPGTGQPFSMPREMTIEEIKTCVQQFRQGAINAMEAGFDGVEVRCSSVWEAAAFVAVALRKPVYRDRNLPLRQCDVRVVCVYVCH